MIVVGSVGSVSCEFELLPGRVGVGESNDADNDVRRRRS